MDSAKLEPPPSGAAPGPAALSSEPVQEPDLQTQTDLALEEPLESRSVTSAGAMIVFEAVTKVYDPDVVALRDVSFTIDKGEFVFVVGASGSGKSTLIRLLLKEIEPTRGRLFVGGRDLGRLKHSKVPLLRRNLGCVFQDFKLLPNRSAAENVAYALKVQGDRPESIRKKVPEALSLVGLSHKATSLPDELSGGEQQRVSIARAVVNHPALLICDEPTGNLDPDTSVGIMQLLYRINRAGTTVLMVTHDREMVDKMRKRVIALDAGRLARDERRGGYEMSRFRMVIAEALRVAAREHVDDGRGLDDRARRDARARNDDRPRNVAPLLQRPHQEAAPGHRLLQHRATGDARADQRDHAEVRPEGEPARQQDHLRLEGPGAQGAAQEVPGADEGAPVQSVPGRLPHPAEEGRIPRRHPSAAAADPTRSRTMSRTAATRRNGCSRSAGSSRSFSSSA